MRVLIIEARQSFANVLPHKLPGKSGARDVADATSCAVACVRDLSSGYLEKLAATQAAGRLQFFCVCVNQNDAAALAQFCRRCPGAKWWSTPNGR
jgi:hypothetical protein